MMTKDQLSKIYHEVEAIAKDIRVKNRRLDSARLEIMTFALQRDYEKVDALVSEVETLKPEIELLYKAKDNRYAKLREKGYSYNDARFYATGIRGVYLGGQPVAIKKAK